jgi:ribonuclease inhibitor
MDSPGREFLEIDLSSVQTSEELQGALAEALGFPDWYGHNWNAFWDCISGIVEMPKSLRIRGWAHLIEVVPHDARLMRECLQDLAREYPESSSEVEWA